MDDLGTNELQAFFRRHYGPQKLTVAVVGATTASEVGSPPIGWVLYVELLCGKG